MTASCYCSRPISTGRPGDRLLLQRCPHRMTTKGRNVHVLSAFSFSLSLPAFFSLVFLVPVTRILPFLCFFFFYGGTNESTAYSTKFFPLLCVCVCVCLSLSLSLEHGATHPSITHGFVSSSRFFPRCSRTPQ